MRKRRLHEGLILCTLITFFSFSKALFSQNTNFELTNITKKDGLPGNDVVTLFKDSRGLLWIGTTEGLASYDAYKFKVYRNETENPNSLSSNKIFHVAEDKSGDLYVGTFQGLNKYHRNTSSFSHYYKDTTSTAPLISNFFLFSMPDASGDVWCVIPDGTGFKILNPKTKKFKVPTTPGLAWFCIAKNGNVWQAIHSGSTTHILNYNPLTKKIKKYNYTFPSSPSRIRQAFRRLEEDKNGNLWIGLEYGLSHLDGATGNVKHFLPEPQSPAGLPLAPINDFDFDEEGKVWLASDSSGLIRLDPITKKCQVLRANPNSKTTILSNQIASIVYDNGVLWAATKKGLSKIVIRDKKFDLLMLYKDKNDNQLFEGSEISDVIKTRNGSILFCTKKGLYEYHSFNNADLIYEGDVKEIVEDSAGTLWLAGFLTGLKKFDYKTKAVQDYQTAFHTSDTLPVKQIWSCYLDNKGIIWLGTGGEGLVGVTLWTGKIIRFNYDPKNPGSISTKEVGPILRDGNCLWIGPYQGGVNKIDLITGQVAKYQNIPKNPASLSSNIVTSFLKDSKGRIWIGTADGLNILDERTGKFTRLYEKDGLLSSSIGINGIFEDVNNTVWVSTLHGLSKFDEAEFTFRSYDERDGFPRDMSSGYFDKNKKIYIFGNGITSFDPAQIKDNSFPPPIIITDIQIFNKSVNSIPDSPIKGNISEVKGITLNYDEAFLTFEFAALNFKLSDKNQYAYKMEGFDKEWNFSGTRRLAYYTSIPPGEYVFKVRAANNDGVWNEKGLSLKLTITPPFWETWWFRSLVCISILGSLALWYKTRMKAIKKQKEELERQVKERTAEVEAQAEEIKSQSEKMEELFNETKDSIRAAQLIQQSILPSESFIKQHLPEVFILNKPKDVVSGDFYWFDVIEEKIVIAAVDCTGHGVSGAFMSITGHFLLNQAVKASGKLSASAILEKLHEGVIHELHDKNKDTGIQDGMDIALCILDKKNNRVEYAGANNPLYILRDGEIIQVKPNRYSIGLTLGEKVSKFTNNCIDLLPGDILYIFSDGYADQLGGNSGEEKFMYSRFRNLLIEIHQKEMREQMERLEDALMNWKKEVEQLDDIMVIGIKV